MVLYSDLFFPFDNCLKSVLQSYKSDRKIFLLNQSSTSYLSSVVILDLIGNLL